MRQCNKYQRRDFQGHIASQKSPSPSQYRGVSNLRSHTFEQSVCVTLNLTSAEKQSVCVTLNLTSAEKQSVCDVKWAVIGFARNGCVRTSISVQSVHDY